MEINLSHVLTSESKRSKWDLIPHLRYFLFSISKADIIYWYLFLCTVSNLDLWAIQNKGGTICLLTSALLQLEQTSSTWDEPVQDSLCVSWHHQPVQVYFFCIGFVLSFFRAIFGVRLPSLECRRQWSQVSSRCQYVWYM